jgi:predicted Zn-dependent peptidase
VIGSMEDLDAASLDDVSSFFRTFYVPSNAVLTLAGDFESERALGLVTRYFGDIPAGSPLPALPGRPELPVHIGETLRERVVGEVPLPRVIVAFRVPPYADSDFHVAELAGSILGVGRASRLYRSLVRERRVAKDVVTYVFPLVTGAALFLAWATGYREISIESLEQALIEEIHGLANVRETELERALAVSEIRLVEEIERLESRADLLSMFETHFGDAGRLNGELDRLRAVTVPRIRDFTEAYLGEHNQVLLAYEPQRRSGDGVYERAVDS